MTSRTIPPTELDRMDSDELDAFLDREPELKALLDQELKDRRPPLAVGPVLTEREFKRLVVAVFKLGRGDGAIDLDHTSSGNAWEAACYEPHRH